MKKLQRPKSRKIEKTEKTAFPRGWDEERVRRVIEHYEKQTEDEAAAEDEAAFLSSNQTMMEVPNELVPAVLNLIARRQKTG